jgi:hypothetical protein
MSAVVNAEKLIDRVLIWRNRKAHPDLSIPALAQLVRKPEHVVRRAVKLLEVPPKEILQAFEHEAVQAWTEAVPIAGAKGDHRPAKDLLLHTRAIDPVQLVGQQQIAIIFAGSLVPGLSVGPGEGPSTNQIGPGNDAIDGSVLPVCPVQADRGADTPPGAPPAAPANASGLFVSETVPVELGAVSSTITVE